MSKYNFDIRLESENKTWEIEVDSQACYGYFEHINGGEGGLWFSRTQTGLLELLDYDGFGVLPKAVCRTLRADPRFFVDEEFD